MIPHDPVMGSRIEKKTGGFFFSGHPSQKAPPKSAMLPSICDADAMGKGKKMGKGWHMKLNVKPSKRTISTILEE